MDRTREELRDDLLALLNASRELPTVDDEILAESFMNRLERRRQRHPRVISLTSMYLAVLAVLVAIPIVMIVQTYSAMDGYLPQPDAGALPAIYWAALALVLILLAASVLGNRTSWRMQLTLSRSRER